MVNDGINPTTTQITLKDESFHLMMPSSIEAPYRRVPMSENKK